MPIEITYANLEARFFEIMKRVCQGERFTITRAGIRRWFGPPMEGAPARSDLSRETIRHFFGECGRFARSFRELATALRPGSGQAFAVIAS
jgi:hypothetical protein